ncbi:unnamed protein product [Knipowitschia caucasica]|uniref:Uncharacterized protein n=1 Tax=Knipowitschia caucasica TaxID=637954 RepID=A0AAV2KA85_KNICA
MSAPRSAFRPAPLRSSTMASRTPCSPLKVAASPSLLLPLQTHHTLRHFVSETLTAAASDGRPGHRGRGERAIVSIFGSSTMTPSSEV